MQLNQITKGWYAIKPTKCWYAIKTTKGWYAIKPNNLT